MHIPFFSFFMTALFEDIEEHAQQIKDYAWAFQQAAECFLNDKCESFEEHKQELLKIEMEADVVKRRILDRISKSFFFPVNKFQLFLYVKNQNDILVCIKDALEWLSYRGSDGIPAHLHKDFYLLVDASIEPIEELNEMVAGAKKALRKFSEKQRMTAAKITGELRQKKNAAKKAESFLKQKIFSLDGDAASLFFLVRLSEKIGKISLCAESAADSLQGILMG